MEERGKVGDPTAESNRRSLAELASLAETVAAEVVNLKGESFSPND